MNSNVYDRQFWSVLDDFLMKERDSVLATITHLRLAVGAAAVVTILLCVKSFSDPLVAYFETKSNVNPASIALLISSAVATVLILVVVLSALSFLNRALKRALLEGLRKRIQAIELACEEAGVEIDERTQKLLKTMNYDDYSAPKTRKESQDDS